MYRLLLVILIGVLSASVYAQTDPQVTNVVAAPQADGLVRITYDLTTPNNAEATVQVRVSDNGGSSFDVEAERFSGAVGPEVIPGVGLEIFWDAAADLPFGFSGQWQVKVIALEGDGRLLERVLLGGATMLFARIEPGEFTMGTPTGEDGRRDDEGPPQQVTITQPFYISVHEITQAQWTSVMNEGTPSERPQTDISWADLQGFIAALNQDDELTYRMPTEAEWELAARAGSSAPWSFGDDESLLADHAWYDANAQDQTQRVGQNLPNGNGLFDMHGNVWEWVQDSFARYSGFPQTDPLVEGVGDLRVFRGGGFNFPAARTRSGARGYNTPVMRAGWLGGRVVLEAP
jgi:formylglycine-generating enzyme required for sulfatase activity